MPSSIVLRLWSFVLCSWHRLPANQEHGSLTTGQRTLSKGPAYVPSQTIASEFPVRKGAGSDPFSDTAARRDPSDRAVTADAVRRGRPHLRALRRIGRNRLA